MGDATATPSVKANHSSARRASQGELRRMFRENMLLIMASAKQLNPALRLCGKLRAR